jgi:DNA-binding NarL/FixJ family response regulator
VPSTPDAGVGLTAKDSHTHRLAGTVGGESAAKRCPPSAPGASEPLRVMIVDDHPLISELVLRVCQMHEWIEVVACGANGRDAVMLASATRPDVVIMDIEMPLMDGIEATLRILARMSPVVIVLTASATDAERDAALAAGAFVVLPKTIDPALLVGYLQNIHLEQAAAPGQRLARGA